MGTSHTELSRHTYHYEDPAGVFCPGSSKLRSVLGLPLRPGGSPYLHPPRHQARGEGGRGPSQAHYLRSQGDRVHQRVRVRCSLPGRGEARRKRSADEEAEVKAAPVLSYAGLPFAGYPYAGYPYAHYPYVAPTYAVAEPKVTEVEIPQIVYKPVEEKIELAPLCHNGAGFAVPCA